MTGQTWSPEDGGLCAETDPEIFFPEKGGSTADAKRVCGACEHLTACGQWALDTRQEFGVWGGVSAKERRRLLHPGAPQAHPARADRSQRGRHDAALIAGAFAAVLGGGAADALDGLSRTERNEAVSKLAERLGIAQTAEALGVRRHTVTSRCADHRKRPAAGQESEVAAA